MVSGSDARLVGQSYLQNLQVQSLAQHDRMLCFELLECLLDRYSDAVAALGDDLVYGICEAIDGEKDPRCLMLTFHLVEVLAWLFPEPSGPLASFAGDIFEILGCYFPIHFTHQQGDDFDIKRDDLSRALMLAFSSSPLFEPFAIPLLLEKLSSSLPLAKVDSFRYLSHCVLKYGVDRMGKHAKAIWSSLKDAIFTFSLQGNIFSLASDLPDTMGFEENDITKEALICLEKVILQNDGIFLSLIVDDEDVEMILRSVTISNSYNSLSVESKQKLLAFGRIIVVSAKISSSSCDRIFHFLFPRLMDILGLSSSSLSLECIPYGSPVSFGQLNFGAIYLCTELLAACRDLIVGSEDIAPQSVLMQVSWCCLLQRFSGPLTTFLSSSLVTSMKQENCDANIYSGVKGLRTLATFPGWFLPISKSIFENILTVFMSILTAGCEETLLWKLSLKALVQIGTFTEKFHDSERATSYMNIVVGKIVSSISLDDSSMPYSLKLDAIAEIGGSGMHFMLKVIQGLEEAISANFFEASSKGNLKSVEVLIPLLECFSKKVLPWFHKTSLFEDIVFHFVINIWNQMEANTTFNIGIKANELLDVTMMVMRQAVADCSEKNQGLIVQKAYNILSSSASFSLKEPMPLSIPLKTEGLQLTQNLQDFSCRDEWLISLFASVIMALRPQTCLPDVRVVLELFMSVVLKGHVPAAQALGSIINKLPATIDSVEVSRACTLEEAMVIISKMNLWSVNGNSSFRKCNVICKSVENLTDLDISANNNAMVQTNVLVGLAWIGKGLLMRGHEKVKDITMTLLRCLLSTINTELLPIQHGLSGNDSGQDMHPLVMKSAADAFHILMSDSEICLNKRFHATVRPLYKQHFFSIMMPILLSSITGSDSSITRSFLYRAFGHVISNTPLVAVITECKKLIPVLLDSLAVSSVDILDKDLTYSLLLVISGIIMDENGREAVTENAHIIINCLVGLLSYPHMMLVRETAIQCLVAMSGLPHVRIYPMRTQVLRAISKALDDPKRVVRQEAVRCRQAWASMASRSLYF
ncbi:PREDICTED: MMS19 nucleotide excision repair protein homolog isoform X2 [Nelumbo nucifera]|nr:PREDICTED: MMS19 nucleotide excision repair protein homolog isoform X2 [Nelumbo nucifera]